ncbi:hypothetical protein VE03_00897 [Pseudogymnoascus sp. 23342-1-I1]|nr:hypothetical protein VE03_00897 [Pseudogymnoascus sp. 23342-1-I1]
MTTSYISFLPLKDPQGLRAMSVMVVPDFMKNATAPEYTRDWVDSMMPLDGTQTQVLSILSGPTTQLRYMALLNIVAGVVFFGTPHPKTKEREEWYRLTLLLKLAGDLPKRFIAQSELDANAAATICEDFEQSGLDATVLSIYETNPTKISSIRWLKWPKVKVQVIIDKAFAETWAKKEKLLGNDVSHEGVSNFYPQSLSKFVIQKEILLLLTSAFKMPTHNMTISGMPGPNFAERKAFWEGSTAPESSEEVNLGSSVPSNIDVIPSNDMGEYAEDEFESNMWPCYLWDRSEEQTRFVGREDTFEAIDDCFFTPTSSGTIQSPDNIQQLPCCCISGLGGMGKTQTAIQYAAARQKQFDAIFVIQAENSPKLSEGFYKIALTLGLSGGADKIEEKSAEKNDENAEENTEEDFVVNRSKALKWLSSPKFSASALGQRAEVLADIPPREPNWLLIFDNVEDSSILRDYWPVSNVGCILVTTRDDGSSNYLRSQSHVTHIYLDKLDAAPASELFLQLSFMDLNEININDASAIVNKLGGHPLAIEQVAAYIRGKSMALKEFLSLYDKTLLERRKKNTGGHSWSYEIVASWALESLNDSASSLLRVYSFLDPDGIQDSILTDFLIKNHASTLPEDYPDDQLSHIDARKMLLKSSLIRVNMGTTPVIVRMHRLVQDIALARMAISQITEVFTFVTAVIFKAWPFTNNNWDHQASLWSTQEALLQHIFRLSHIMQAYNISNLELSLKRKFITLLSSGGWYRQERGDFDSGIPLFELGVQICADSPNDFLDLRADLSFGLGGATCDTNRWSEFIVHARDQLDYRLRSDDAAGILPTSNTAIAYSELGIAQALMKQYEDGVNNCNEAIRIYAMQTDVIDGSFFPAFPHLHRALALVGAGRPQEGERGLLDLIRWHETRFATDHTEFKLGYAWQCCGLIYARTGRPNESIAAYRKALAHYKATVGMLYHRTGNVCGKIAEYHESLSQFEAAEFYFKEAQAAYSSQPHYKPELARHYFILSQAFHGRGDEEAAKTALQKSQTLYKEVVPRSEPVSMSLGLLNGIVAPWVW